MTPIHWSAQNGVHADLHTPSGSKIHIPYVGQTTLDMFPGFERSRSLPQQLSAINQHGLGTLRG
jgi:hypothetical protein